MIKNVIFDVGMVLVDFRWRSLMKELALPEELHPEFKKNVFGSHWWNELDRGIYEESVVLEKLRRDNSAHSAEFDLIWSHRDRLVEAFDYSLPWIERLKSRGLKVYLLSNYPRELFALHERCGRFPFIDKVDGKVVSGFVRMVKPEARIYEHLMREHGLEAPECIFIDDRAENVEAAKALGMKGIVFENYAQADAALDRELPKSP